MINKTDESIITYDNIVKETIDYYNKGELKNKLEFQEEADLIINMLTENATILDVGTGIGLYPKYLTEKCNKNFNVLGIDTSKNMLEVAKKEAPKAKFQVMDMRNMTLSNNSYDAILCLATLIHVDDEQALKIMESFDKLLKPNGVIIINAMEHLSGSKEIYDVEPFNPKYNMYYNRYNKNFFLDFFSMKDYEIVDIIDHPIYNIEQVENADFNTNQFSIVAKKN